MEHIPGPFSSTIGVRELRLELATYLARAEAGEETIVSRAGRPIARLAPLFAEAATEAGLGDMARWGLIVAPRHTGRIHPNDVAARSTSPPVDVRVDRIVRQVRG